ncbi:quinone oxidoreductase [Nocardioides sp.]|uniref:quinone oxidoreductase family protein n=1 Tax=Nocardioides sp. TaxID=35761 RepID=UPI002735AC88|nr:quinone oxidoreductase [Nocardioides sp.]MDP3891582.1 quinone oxidoreductase [Nocardioides sp.]
MRAVVVEQTGGPEVLQVQDRPTPEPGPDEVRVDVAAAGVNFIDTYQRSGAYPLETPFVLGSEGAGTVSAVGAEVSDLAVGDRVAWAMVNGAGYAEQVLLPAARAVPVPGAVDTETAAAVMLQGMTAHYLATSTFEIRPGHTALVHAAAGGAGLLLTQLVTARGGRVIGTTSTREKAELALAAGASDVVLYTEQDLVTEVRRLTGDRGVDVVYDGVGADTFEASLDCLAVRGTMVLYGAASGPVPPFGPQVLNAKGSLFLTRPALAHYVVGDELTERATAVLDAVAAGELDVRIGGRYSLDQAADAHRDLTSRRTTGKLLLIP